MITGAAWIALLVGAGFADAQAQAIARYSAREVGVTYSADAIFDECVGSPRPGHKASGEERAWSRRLAKRFGAEGRIDDRTFVVTGDGNPSGAFDFSVQKPETIDSEVAALFAPLEEERRDVLIAFGWAMAEDLAGGKLGR